MFNKFLSKHHRQQVGTSCRDREMVLSINVCIYQSQQKLKQHVLQYDFVSIVLSGEKAV